MDIEKFNFGRTSDGRAVDSPDGKILPVENTPMDLRKLQAIGEHIDSDFNPVA